MLNERKTKTQLIRELEEARRQLAAIKGPNKVRSRRSFLQTLLDTIPSSIFYKDTHGVYMGCNRA